MQLVWPWVRCYRKGFCTCDSLSVRGTKGDANIDVDGEIVNCTLLQLISTISIIHRWSKHNLAVAGVVTAEYKVDFGNNRELRIDFIRNFLQFFYLRFHYFNANAQADIEINFMIDSFVLHLITSGGQCRDEREKKWDNENSRGVAAIDQLIAANCRSNNDRPCIRKYSITAGRGILLVRR